MFKASSSSPFRAHLLLNLAWPKRFLFPCSLPVNQCWRVFFNSRSCLAQFKQVKGCVPCDIASSRQGGSTLLMPPVILTPRPWMFINSFIGINTALGFRLASSMIALDSAEWSSFHFV